MSDIASGESYADGQTVNATRLNNMVNGAVIQPGLISGKANKVTPAGTDTLLILEGSTLKKCLVSSLPSSGGTVSSVGMTVPTGFAVSPPTITTTGTFAVTIPNQNLNKVLRSPADGSSGAVTFRATDVRDLTIPTAIVAAANIDWNLGPTFYKEITGNITFTFSNAANGTQIKLWVNGAFTITWPGTIDWAAGVPNQAALINVVYEFVNITGNVFGKRWNI
jgi:hypothetical protein